MKIIEVYKKAKKIAKHVVLKSVINLIPPLPSHLFDMSTLLKKITDKNENVKFIPRSVILVNVGLGAGGSERQIVNTLIGLKKKDLESVTLLCKSLDPLNNLNFYMPILNENNIKVDIIQKIERHFQNHFIGLEHEEVSFLRFLPRHVSEDIINLYFEFKARSPEVVYAWQDDTCLKVGVAALMAGVPKVILTTRNMAPIHFAYYQPYMWVMYKVLSDIHKVQFVNNSEAGAKDYTLWLDLPSDKFIVVKNGIKLEKPKNLMNMIEFRKSLEIPETSKIVGSIFRFYPEKRPLLWVKTAIKLSKMNSDYYFLIAGDGPLKNEMQKLIRKNNLQTRFSLIGNNAEVPLILSLMDVFLLTSKYEGTPNVVLEAQCMGVPVVALNAGGTAEALINGKTGYLSYHEDPEKLANIINDLLLNQPFCQAVKEEGPKFIKENFCMDSMVSSTIKLFGFS